MAWRTSGGFLLIALLMASLQWGIPPKSLSCSSRVNQKACSPTSSADNESHSIQWEVSLVPILCHTSNALSGDRARISAKVKQYSTVEVPPQISTVSVVYCSYLTYIHTMNNERTNKHTWQDTVEFATQYNTHVLLYTVQVAICNSYNMDTRALAHLLHEGEKHLRAINELSARASML